MPHFHDIISLDCGELAPRLRVSLGIRTETGADFTECALSGWFRPMRARFRSVRTRFRPVRAWNDEKGRFAVLPVVDRNGFGSLEFYQLHGAFLPYENVRYFFQGRPRKSGGCFNVFVQKDSGRLFVRETTWLPSFAPYEQTGYPQPGCQQHD